MAKLLVVAGIIVLAFFLLTRKKSTDSTNESSMKKNAREMVECESCGNYVSSDEAVWARGKWYCGAKCLKERDDSNRA